MRITKLQSRLLAGVFLVAFFVISIVLVQRSRSTLPTVPTRSLAPLQSATPTVVSTNAITGSQFSLENFHRSEVKDGKVVWEVRAARGDYSPQQNLARLSNAVLNLFRKSGEVVELRATEALLSIEGTSLHQAEAKRGVTLIYDSSTTVETESASYDHASSTVRSSQPTTIRGETFLLVGGSLLANMAKKELTLQNRVHSEFRAVKVKSPPGKTDRRKK